MHSTGVHRDQSQHNIDYGANKVRRARARVLDVLDEVLSRGPNETQSSLGKFCPYSSVVVQAASSHAIVRSCRLPAAGLQNGHQAQLRPLHSDPQAMRS
jgi:hypothetical protein